jgi:CheY-like chemotaxis protein
MHTMNIHTAANLKVLIVDDNADAAEMLSALMQIIGHTSAVAHDGENALRICAEFHPDVIFLDLGMPGMNGYEVAQRIQAGASTPKPVLVALTGWGDESDRARTQAAGFQHHLIKPTSLEAVESLLADLSAKQS